MVIFFIIYTSEFIRKNRVFTDLTDEAIKTANGVLKP